MGQVIIGCKLPNGLTMELIKQAPQKQGIIPAPRGQRVTLKGANTTVVARTNPADAGFGETAVDEDFWNEWLKANREMDFVRKGFVFVAKSAEQFKAEARDRMAERTNLEPLNPQTDKEGNPLDPRMQGGITADPEGGAAGTKARTAPEPVA